MKEKSNKQEQQISTNFGSINQLMRSCPQERIQYTEKNSHSKMFASGFFCVQKLEKIKYLTIEIFT